jgi:NAD(P)-dependent dehydrogenase (short-subunit alcohol dehydrogenase family)
MALERAKLYIRQTPRGFTYPVSTRKLASQLFRVSLGPNFHQVNAADSKSLAGAFQKVFDAEGCADFVFANAGIVERYSFSEKAETKAGSRLLRPTMATLDVNMNSVVTTTYLAMHYMRLSPHRGKDTTTVATINCGGPVGLKPQMISRECS